MDKVQKPRDAECYAPPSELFRFYLSSELFHVYVIVLFALFRQVSQLSFMFMAPHRRNKMSNAGEWAGTPINDA
jgi:hypothetical protein